MSQDCIFCKIIENKIPSDIVFSNDNIIVIKDKFPKAPIHLLAIPKIHIATLTDITSEHKMLFGDIMYQIAQNSINWGLKDGFRVINNCGHNGRQEIYHIHWHVVGGKKLSQ